jgi:hypothetical protein
LFISLGLVFDAVATTMRADTRQEIEQSDISKAFKVNTKWDG